jgi:acyl-CoA dehydrogenase
VDFTIPEELRLVQHTVRRFVQEEMAPLENVYEEGMPYEEELRWRKRAREMGLFMMHVPVEHGGGGVNTLGMALVYEEVEKTTLGADFILGIDQPDPVSIMGVGSDALKERYMYPAIRGERYWGFALSEPGAGSDAQGIQTTAVRDGDEWVINGTKLWISRMRVADFAIVFAVTDKEKRARGGISAFIVDKGTPGFEVSRAVRTMDEAVNNWRGPTELSFRDCRIPAGNLLGAEGEAFKIAQGRLGAQRTAIAARCVGLAERALDMAMAYAKARQTFGAPVATRQGIQWMFADAAVQIHAARLMTYHCAWKWDQKQDVRLETSMVKVFATEMACRIIDMAMQVHGGMGYSKELPLERMYRHARLYPIGEGPTEIHKDLIARLLLAGRRPG